jgi:uncharacterized protein
MDFEWDDEKRHANLAKHRVDFSAATLIFQNECVTKTDSRRDYGETRKIALGQSGELVLAVVYVERRETIRIISARKASRDERRYFSEVLAERDRRNDRER